MAKRDRFAECEESILVSGASRDVLRADLKWALKEIRRLRKLALASAVAKAAQVPAIVTYEMAMTHLEAGGVVEMDAFRQRKGSGARAMVRIRWSGKWGEWVNDPNHSGMSREPGTYVLLSCEGDV